MGTAGLSAFSESGTGESLAGMQTNADHPGVRFLEQSKGIRVLPIQGRE